MLSSCLWDNLEIDTDWVCRDTFEVGLDQDPLCSRAAGRSGTLTLIAESIDDQALSNQLHFRPDAGQIELFDHCMLLMHGFSVAALRRELIERLGLDRTVSG